MKEETKRKAQTQAQAQKRRESKVKEKESELPMDSIIHGWMNQMHKQDFE